MDAGSQPLREVETRVPRVCMSQYRKDQMRQGKSAPGDSWCALALSQNCKCIDNAHRQPHNEADPMASINVSIRMDAELREQAEQVFYQLGMTLNGTINLFLWQCTPICSGQE